MKKTVKLEQANYPQQNLFVVDPVPPKQKQPTEEDWTFDILDALNAPILTFSQLWADTLPKRVLDVVPMARMIALMKNERTATYAECAVYIYTRTFEAPMDYEWGKIYTYVVCHTMETWFGEDHWKEMNIPTVLDEWLNSKLDGLRRHIYTKRREVLKSRIKQENHNEFVPAKSETPNKGNSVEQGTFLF